MTATGEMNRLGTRNRTRQLIYIKVDALNQVIGLNTHLDDARLKFVLFRIYNHVQMCRKQN